MGTAFEGGNSHCVVLQCMYCIRWWAGDAGGGIHPQFIPYRQLTDDEKRVDRDRAQELMRYIQTSGFRIIGYVRHFQ